MFKLAKGLERLERTFELSITRTDQHLDHWSFEPTLNSDFIIVLVSMSGRGV